MKKATVPGKTMKTFNKMAGTKGAETKRLARAKPKASSSGGGRSSSGGVGKHATKGETDKKRQRRSQHK